MKRTIVAAMAASTLVVAAGWGIASVRAEDKLAIITDRQATMKAQGKALEMARFYADGRAEQADAIKAVTDLIKLTGSVVEKFPPGTSTTDFPGKSGAKPAIWAEWDKFKDAPKAAIAQEEKLLQLIKDGDKAGVAKQAGATWNDGCQVCHTPYREKLG
jgi:cytochrome c556